MVTESNCFVQNTVRRRKNYSSPIKEEEDRSIICRVRPSTAFHFRSRMIEVWA